MAPKIKYGAGKLLQAKSVIRKIKGGKIGMKETRAKFEGGVEIVKKIGVELYNSECGDDSD